VSGAEGRCARPGAARPAASSRAKDRIDAALSSSCVCTATIAEVRPVLPRVQPPACHDAMRDSFGYTGIVFRAPGWKVLIVSGRVAPKAPSAPHDCTA
jgi:hypothetical protein